MKSRRMRSLIFTLIVVLSSIANISNAFRSASSISPTKSLTMLSSAALAVGQDFTGSEPPLLAKSIDGGNTWAVQNIPGIPPSGMLFGSMCSGAVGTGICIAVGEDFTGSLPPLLVMSRNGGMTWSKQNIDGLTTFGIFFATSCTGNGSAGVCIAAGQDLTGSQAPLLVTSTDGGTTWQLAIISGLPESGFFSGANCSITNDATTTCMVVGQDLTGSQPPLLVTSTDGGVTWSKRSIPGLTSKGFFNSASCLDNSGVCVVTGQDATGTLAPLLIKSSDGGATWNIQTVQGLPSSGYFSGVSCSGTRTTGVCAAAGYDLTGTQPPLLVTSTDGGNTWSTQRIAGLTNNGYFNGVSCSGNAGAGICIAVGQDLTNAEAPLLVKSIDGGKTWNIQNIITNIPASGSLYGASCLGNGSAQDFCFAAGQDATGNQPPLLVVSTNGGATWSVQSIARLPASGFFNGTSISNTPMGLSSFAARWKKAHANLYTKLTHVN